MADVVEINITPVINDVTIQIMPVVNEVSITVDFDQGSQFPIGGLPFDLLRRNEDNDNVEWFRYTAGVRDIMILTQAEYDLLTPDDFTLYLIRE